MDFDIELFRSADLEEVYYEWKKANQAIDIFFEEVASEEDWNDELQEMLDDLEERFRRASTDLHNVSREYLESKGRGEVESDVLSYFIECLKSDDPHCLKVLYGLK